MLVRLLCVCDVGVSPSPSLPQVIAVAKSSDLILMVLDASKSDNHRQILTRELNAVGIRLNKKPPQIYFKKKKTGGITFSTTVPLTHMDERLAYQILHEYKIHNAEILFREDVTADDFIDVIEGNRRYIRCLYTYNKIDVLSIEEVDELARKPYSVPISCSMELGLDHLLAETWRAMDLKRIYTKKARSSVLLCVPLCSFTPHALRRRSPPPTCGAPSLGRCGFWCGIAGSRPYAATIYLLLYGQVGNKPDFAEPVMLSEARGGNSVQSFCDHLHASLAKEFSYALVWGTSSKHYPQRCGLTHVLDDEDVVQIVKKKTDSGERERHREVH